jgi:hypothetical protein
MTIRNFVLVATLAAVSSTFFAPSGRAAPPKPATDRAGSADDQAACRPDVRRFCHKLEQDAGDLVFLACLQEHRDKLRKPCLNVLEKNGQ